MDHYKGSAFAKRGRRTRATTGGSVGSRGRAGSAASRHASSGPIGAAEADASAAAGHDAEDCATGGALAAPPAVAASSPGSRPPPGTPTPAPGSPGASGRKVTYSFEEYRGDNGLDLLLGNAGGTPRGTGRRRKRTTSRARARSRASSRPESPGKRPEEEEGGLESNTALFKVKGGVVSGSSAKSGPLQAQWENWTTRVLRLDLQRESLFVCLKDAKRSVEYELQLEDITAVQLASAGGGGGGQAPGAAAAAAARAREGDRSLAGKRALHKLEFRVFYCAGAGRRAHKAAAANLKFGDEEEAGAGGDGGGGGGGGGGSGSGGRSSDHRSKKKESSGESYPEEWIAIRGQTHQ